MKRLFYVPCVIAAGLLSTQLIATLHVYLSNRSLMETVETIGRHGYLSIPNMQTSAHLGSLTTAMAGGLFFTLSLGSGLSLLTLAGLWLRTRLRTKAKAITWFLCGLWCVGLLAVNSNGLNIFATAYVAIVPLISALFAVFLSPTAETKTSASSFLSPVFVALLLALSWSTVFDKQIFTTVRDHLLLSNPIGEAITNAYYEYTLYPAEAFKALSQKQIRTSTLGSTTESFQRKRMEKGLRIRDYLPVGSGDPADITVEYDGGRKDILLRQNQYTLLRYAEHEFFQDIGKALNAFSKKQDRNGTFRRITLVCLLLGFPLVLFTLVYTTLKMLASMLLAPVLSDIVAGLICLSIGLALLLPVHQGHRAMSTTNDAAKDLESPSAFVRLAALKRACQDRLDIFDEAKKLGIAKSSSIAERYWFARNLVYAKKQGASVELFALANDPVPIVACQALWSIGRRKDSSAIPVIIEQIQTSSHWYVQMYGYRALKEIGWVQPRSPLSF
jgi:hypothetical protein